MVEANLTRPEPLTLDFSTSCMGEQYEKTLIYAYLMAFIYPVGVPALYWILLYRCGLFSLSLPRFSTRFHSLTHPTHLPPSLAPRPTWAFQK